MRTILKGSTDQSVVIRIIDDTTGQPETGVEYNSSGIDLWYRREGATRTSLTEAALAALDSAHADGGIEHIGDGYYRLDLPDAACATGANGVVIGGTVTGMVVIGAYVHLVDYNPQDAVRLGLTALPNAAADAAGGLIISDAGGLDADAQLVTKINDILTDTGTTLQGEVDGIQADTEDIQARLPAALVSGRIDASVGAMAANVITAAATAADFSTEVNTAVIAVLGTPAGASMSADIAAIEGQTDDIGAAGAGLTAVPWNAAWDAEVQSEVQDALVANNLDHLVLSAVDTNFATTVHADSVIGQLADNGAGFDRTTDSLEAIRDNIGTAGAGLTSIDLPNQTMDITGNITGNLSGTVGSVTGNVGGNVTGSVGSVATGGIAAASFAAGAIDAAAIAADAIGASELAAGAVDEILDDTIGDGTITVRQALRVILAATAGKLGGAATTTVTIRNTADSADVIVATVDADGNRTAVTVTP